MSEKVSTGSNNRAIPAHPERLLERRAEPDPSPRQPEVPNTREPEDGQRRFPRYRPNACGNTDFQNRHDRATFAAIAAYTHEANIDDDGQPLIVGAWYLLISLQSICRRHGVDFAELLRNVAEYEAAHGLE